MKWRYIRFSFLECHGSYKCLWRCLRRCGTGRFGDQGLHLGSEACEQLFRCNRTKEACGTTTGSFRTQPTAGTASSPLSKRLCSVSTSRKDPGHLMPQPPIEKRSFTLGSAREIQI